MIWSTRVIQDESERNVGAEQAVMAVDILSFAMGERDAELQSSLDRLYAIVEDDDNYQAEQLVREFESVADDVGSLRKWWSSRLLRVFLVFLLTTLGSLIGTYVGGFEIVSNLF